MHYTAGGVHAVAAQRGSEGAFKRRYYVSSFAYLRCLQDMQLPKDPAMERSSLKQVAVELLRN
eukprot:635935-Amphidinium_carterae.2